MPFRLPTRIELGPGALSRLETVIPTLPEGAVALVTDEGLRETPWPDRVAEQVSEAGRSVVWLDGVEANPRTVTTDRLAREARAASAASVVAVGGGSVIDAAKGVALLLTNEGSCEDYEGKDLFSQAAAPLVAIPTTCGTGSEVTWVSVLSLEREKRKISVKGDGLFPAWALVDADLLRTLPAALLAQTGMDAMTHAIEAVIGRPANPTSDVLAERAIELILSLLARAVSDPAEDGEAREAVMRGSTLAGMAFGNADVGAVHCLSESIGGLLDLPHGLLNAVLLVPVLRGHGSAVTPRLAKIARRVGVSQDTDDENAASRFLDRLEGLGHAVGIPDFKDLGIPTESHSVISDLAARNGSNGSNLRDWVAADYHEVLSGLPKGRGE